MEGRHFYEKQCPSHRARVGPDGRDPVRARTSTSASATTCRRWSGSQPGRPRAAPLAVAARSRSSGRPRWRSTSTPASRRGDRGVLRGGAAAARRCSSSWGWSRFPKTSGSKGMQVYVPLNADGRPTQDTKPLVAGAGAPPRGAAPQAGRLVQKKELRAGKVLVDWSQNDEHKTTVCVYSLRARERPTVSTPLDLGRGRGGPTTRSALVFEADEVLERVEEHGDLFAPVAELEQQPARALTRLRSRRWSTGRSPVRSRGWRRARRARRGVGPRSTWSAQRGEERARSRAYTGLMLAGARRPPRWSSSAGVGGDQPRLAVATARAGGRAARRAASPSRARWPARCGWAPTRRSRPRRAW